MARRFLQSSVRENKRKLQARPRTEEISAFAQVSITCILSPQNAALPREGDRMCRIGSSAGKAAPPYGNLSQDPRRVSSEGIPLSATQIVRSVKLI